MKVEIKTMVAKALGFTYDFPPDYCDWV